jgi:hypothetical protein
MFWILAGVISLVSVVCAIVFVAIDQKYYSSVSRALAFLSALAGGIGNMIYLCNQDICEVWHVLLGVVFVVTPMLILIIADRYGKISCYNTTLVLLIASTVFLSYTFWHNAAWFRSLMC